MFLQLVHFVYFAQYAILQFFAIWITSSVLIKCKLLIPNLKSDKSHQDRAARQTQQAGRKTSHLDRPARQALHTFCVLSYGMLQSRDVNVRFKHPEIKRSADIFYCRYQSDSVDLPIRLPLLTLPASQTVTQPLYKILLKTQPLRLALL